jgi:hypothetical protein
MASLTIFHSDSFQKKLITLSLPLDPTSHHPAGTYNEYSRSSILEQSHKNNGQLKESVNIHTTSAILLYIILGHTTYKYTTN